MVGAGAQVTPMTTERQGEHARQRRESLLVIKQAQRRTQGRLISAWGLKERELLTRVDKSAAYKA